MKVFRLKNVFFLALLGGLFLISCSKEKGDDVVPDKIEHEDESNFFEYTISGAIKGTKIGKPSWILFADDLSTFQFYGNSTDPNRHLLRIDGNFKYDNAEERTGRMIGISTQIIEGKWTATTGTFPIRNEKIKYNDNQISFRVTYTDKETVKEFGVDDEKLKGEIKVTEAGKGYYSGTFEFLAYEKGGPASSSITVKGKFRQRI